MIEFKPDALRYVDQVDNDFINKTDWGLISNHFNLRQASIEDAIKYGGSLTRDFLSKMQFRGNRKHIIVDTRVSFLLEGSYPSIPGWHTDGVPRGPDLDPASSGAPNMQAQKDNKISAPLYHIGVSGIDCMPEFIIESIHLDTTDDNTLYSHISKQVEERKPETLKMTSGSIWEFDWWCLHRATRAEEVRSWRYLIRVTETDHIEPRKNLNKIIRTHNQVYMPAEFGW